MCVDGIFPQKKSYAAAKRFDDVNFNTQKDKIGESKEFYNSPKKNGAHLVLTLRSHMELYWIDVA